MKRKITKKIEKIGKILLWVILSFVVLDLLIVGALFIKPIQNFAVNKVTTILTQNWGSEISIKHVYLTPTMKIEAHGFVIKDYHHNDMIRVDYVKGRLKNLKMKPFNLFLGTVEGKGGEVVIRKYQGEEKVNIAIWAEKFKKERKSKFLLIIDKVRIKEFSFRFVNDDLKIYPNTTDIDYAFFELKDIDFDCLKFTVNQTDISGKITHLSFQQYTGFQLLNATGNFRINEQQLVFNDALLVTPYSHLFFDLGFSYSHWESYADFIDSVKISANIRPSTLNTEDIAYFAPALKGMKNSLILKGNLLGTVNDFSLQNIHINYATNNFLEGDFALKEVTHIEQLFLDLHIEHSNFDFTELKSLSLPKNKNIAFPEFIEQITDAAVTGTFQGKLTDFTTDLELNSSICTANIDLSIKDKIETIAYDGNIYIAHLNISKIATQQDILKNISGYTHLRGIAANPFSKEDFLATINADIEGKINQLQIKDYQYHNVDFEGNYQDKKYEFYLDSKDENIAFNFSGSANLRGEMPTYYGVLNASHFSLGQIGNSYRSIDSATAKGFDKFIYYTQSHPDLDISISSLKINCSGSSLDELSGTIMLDTLLYTQDSNLLNINALRFVALNSDGLRKYRLTSDIINGSVSTTYPINSLFDTLAFAASHYLPNLFPNRSKKKNYENEVVQSDKEYYFAAQFETFNTRRLLSFFKQDFIIAPSSKLVVYLNSKHHRDSLCFKSKSLRISKKYRLHNIVLRGDNSSSPNTFQLQCSVDSFNLPINNNTFSFKKINLLADVKNNGIDYSLLWNNPDAISSLSSTLSGNVKFLELTHLLLHFSPASSLAVKDYKWQFNENNKLEIKRSTVTFDNVKLYTEKSAIALNGLLVSQEHVPLTVDLTNLDLAILNSFLNNENISFGGDISSELNLSLTKTKKVLNGNVLVTDFIFNGTEFGNVFALASLPTQNNIRFVGGIYESDKTMNSAEIHEYSYHSFEKEKNKVALLNGGYDFKKKEFAIFTNVSSLKVDFLQPFLSSFSHYIEGQASAELAFIARPDTFYFDGKVKIKNGELGIAPLNTIYKIENQQVDFNQQGIEFDRLVLKDKFDNPAILNGYVYHTNFKNMILDLTVESDRILVLNTNKSVDMPFYGDGFIKGKISISGNEKELKFTGNNISTGKGTNFFLPLYFSDITSESDVIIFKEPLHFSQTVEKKKEEGGMEMIFDFSVDITPDAMVQIELDPSIGGTLQARVAGPLRFEYNTTSNMSLMGTLVLQSGYFHLTLKDIIDKMLILTPGGTINFVGPLDLATVQLSGVYKTKAALNDIIPTDDVERTNLRRTPVNAYIHLVGSLFNPAIDFSFELPNSTNDVATLFYSAIDTTVAENRTSQFFSLLVLGKFESSQNAGDMVASAVEYSGVELLTNSINNFISQNLKYVDFGLKYRNADESHAEEYSVSASTSLFNDRVVIEGSFGYTNDKTNKIENSANFIGDYSVEYALDESKNWRVKVFNVTNQYSSLTQSSPYAQGVAIIFKKEFNNKKDFVESWKSTKTKKQKKEKKKK